MQKSNNYAVLDLCGGGGKVGLTSPQRTDKRPILYIQIDAEPNIDAQYMNPDSFRNFSSSVKHKLVPTDLELYNAKLLDKQIERAADTREQKFDEIHCHMPESGGCNVGRISSTDFNNPERVLMVATDWLSSGGRLYHSWQVRPIFAPRELSRDYSEARKMMESMARYAGMEVEKFWKHFPGMTEFLQVEENENEGWLERSNSARETLDSFSKYAKAHALFFIQLRRH